MAGFTGGDFLTITINQSKLGMKKFSLKGGEDVKIIKAGFKKTLTASALESRSRTTAERILGKATGVIIELHSPNDNLYMSALLKELGNYSITLKHISGKTFTGIGSITGDNEFAYKEFQDFSCELTVANWDEKEPTKI